MVSSKVAAFCTNSCLIAATALYEFQHFESVRMACLEDSCEVRANFAACDFRGWRACTFFFFLNMPAQSDRQPYVCSACLGAVIQSIPSLRKWLFRLVQIRECSVKFVNDLVMERCCCCARICSGTRCLLLPLIGCRLHVSTSRWVLLTVSHCSLLSVMFSSLCHCKFRVHRWLLNFVRRTFSDMLWNGNGTITLASRTPRETTVPTL